MERYFCILDENKICDRCGECEMCDLILTRYAITVVNV